MTEEEKKSQKEALDMMSLIENLLLCGQFQGKHAQHVTHAISYCNHVVKKLHEVINGATQKD